MPFKTSHCFFHVISVDPLKCINTKKIFKHDSWISIKRITHRTRINHKLNCRTYRNKERGMSLTKWGYQINYNLLHNSSGYTEVDSSTNIPNTRKETPGVVLVSKSAYLLILIHSSLLIVQSISIALSRKFGMKFKVQYHSSYHTTSSQKFGVKLEFQYHSSEQIESKENSLNPRNFSLAESHNEYISFIQTNFVLSIQNDFFLTVARWISIWNCSAFKILLYNSLISNDINFCKP